MPDHIIRSDDDRARLWRVISGLSKTEPWRVSITKYRARRSLDQNDRFHKLIALLAEETGESPKRLKEWVKAEFGPVDVVNVNGKAREVPKPSHEYTTEEMSAVMDRFEAWCASEMGLSLG